MKCSPKVTCDLTRIDCDMTELDGAHGHGATPEQYTGQVQRAKLGLIDGKCSSENKHCSFGGQIRGHIYNYKRDLKGASKEVGRVSRDKS